MAASAATNAPTSQTILVVGGGIAGMTAAIEAAELGYDVILLEKGPSLGGRVAQLNRYFPKLCHPTCGLEINFQRIRANPRLHVQTMTTVDSVSGRRGDFRVRARRSPRYVKPNCTACGECAKAAGMKVSNPHNYGLDQISAAYLPHAMAFPMRYVVAPDAIGTAAAERIKAACKYDAIDLDEKEQGFELHVGAVVLATGWRPYDASKLRHLGYGASPDVVTSVEIEAMLKEGALKRKSDGRPARTVAFVQCAGSRDAKHLPYCSSVCCGVSIKQALQIRTQDPRASVFVLYDELRTPGTAEEFYRQAQRAGVIFIKGKVKSVGADLTVLMDDAALGQEVPMQGLDLVVLALGMVPNATNLEVTDSTAPPLPAADIDPLSPIRVAGYAVDAPKARNGGTPAPATNPRGASLLNLQYRQGPHLPLLADGFADSHFICFPYETRRSGIYTCGPMRRPMDMAETAEDATGAALKAIQAVESAAEGRGLRPRSGDLSFPKINLDSCTKCRRCSVECPFGAIDETAAQYPIVNPTRCRRCGTCMGACPVRVISFENYSVDMVSSMIKAVEVPDEFAEKPRVLVLACQNDAYPAFDMAGIARRRHSAFVRVIPVRCLGSVSSLWVANALSKGFDGVMMMGCKAGDDYQCHFVKGSAIAQERTQKIGETLKSMSLEKERVANHEVSIADGHRIPGLIAEFMATIDKVGPNPFKGF